MMNYGIFTQIYVLQGFNAKETETSKKSRKKWLRQEMQLCCDIIIALYQQNPRATFRSLSQQEELCLNKNKEECKMTVERLSQHFTTLSRHYMRRSTRKMLQHGNECHNTMVV